MTTSERLLLGEMLRVAKEIADNQVPLEGPRPTFNMYTSGEPDAPEPAVESEEQKWGRFEKLIGWDYGQTNVELWRRTLSMRAVEVRDRILAALDTSRARCEASEAARDGQRGSVTRMCGEIDRLTMACSDYSIIAAQKASLLTTLAKRDSQLAANATEIAGLRGQLAEQLDAVKLAVDASVDLSYQLAEETATADANHAAYVDACEFAESLQVKLAEAEARNREWLAAAVLDARAAAKGKP